MIQTDNNVADLSYLAFVAQENVIKSRMRIIQPYHMDMGQLLNKKNIPRPEVQEMQAK